ncbi:putative bacteriophage protein [Escherichia coli]|nr:putative bacteriophage protein [Escherichia coli]CTT19314.1 putative bacteriophage protein [Escherichia coli]CTT75652.1 putative bacteriophage protein [Escherichia coli]CTU06302.1 putative bacteriophage protein [Escherichia coli]
MSKIDYQKLREIAEKTKIAGEAPVMPCDQRINALNDFMKHFSPDIALALLDERERNQQYIKSRDQENEDIALTVGKLRVELEGKDSKIANLTAERDALREGEMGDAGIATHGPQLISTSNWSRSAKFLLAVLWSSTLTICARSWKPQRSALQS